MTTPEPTPRADITQLLGEIESGRRSAAERLLPLVYDELRRLAQVYLGGERPGHTLQATALVHEAYLKLVDQERAHVRDRAHFFAVAARAMRQILVDHARTRGRAKRGGGASRVDLNESVAFHEGRETEVIALDEALSDLSALDPRQAQMVECYYFGGLTTGEIAGVFECSERTVQVEMAHARGWLRTRVNK